MSSSNINPDSLQKFYKPYLSDEESSGSESDSDGSTSLASSTSESSSGSSLADAKTYEKAPPSEARQNLFLKNGYASIADVSGNSITPSANTNNVPFTLNQPKPTFATTKTSTTVMINSVDRDTNSFPYASAFTIRLPRTYKNVTSVNITQIKLLSAFYYFSDLKSNNLMRIYENGRENIDIYIKNGTYDINALSTELINKLNHSAIYSNLSLDEFSTQFPNTGDFTLLFNYPGDNTYNNLTGAYDALSSKNDIAARYFSMSNTLGIARYTPDETLVAYYYPLLKDLTIFYSSSPALPIISQYANVVSSYSNLKPLSYPMLDYKIEEAGSLLSGTTYYDRVVFSFTGVNDKYILLIVKDQTNRTILDKFKKDNSWENRLTNKYICSYDSNAGRYSISSQQLNTSIYSDLTNQYTNFLTSSLVVNGLNPGQISNLTAAAQNLNSSVVDMYNFIQDKFARFFGVNNGTYSSTFYSELNNNVFIYDAAGRYGWSLAYAGAKTVDSSTVVYPDATVYWAKVAGDASSAISIDGEVFYPNLSSGGNTRYTFTSAAASDSKGFIILDGSSETTFGHQDISLDLSPTSYSRVTFKSGCRQTLYIETTPNKKGQLIEKFDLDPVKTPLLYDKHGDIIIDANAPDFIFYDISQNMMDGADFMRSLDPTGNGFYLQFVSEIKPAINTHLENSSINLLPYRAHCFFKINHGGYPLPAPPKTKFASDIYIEREDMKSFGVEINLYWYRDRSAFMADVKSVLDNTDIFNPSFYMKMQTVHPSETTHVFSTDFVSYENSFLIMLAQSPPTIIPFRIFAIRNKPYGVYDAITDPYDIALRKLPTDLKYLETKPTPLTLMPTEYSSLFDSRRFRNSYDSNGVSNNLLNNIIISVDLIHYDPYNFTDTIKYDSNPLRYSFKFTSPALIPIADDDGKWSQFFYNGSKNVIYDGDGKIYYNSDVAEKETVFYNENEYVFTNWFRAGATTNLFKNSLLNPIDFKEQVLIPEPENDFVDFSYKSDSKSPFSLSLIEGTSLLTDVSVNKVSSVGDMNNVIGIPFLPPPSSTILPTKIVIKFSYSQPTYSSSGLIARNTSLKLLNSDLTYNYSNFSVSTAYSSNEDLKLWDDKYISNRKNVVIGVFYSKDIIGKAASAISLSDAISTLTLKKIVQTGNWKSGSNLVKKRSPEWGTYYIYEKRDKPGKIWFPKSQSVNSGACSTDWATVDVLADSSNYFYTGAFQNNTEIGKYYADVEHNSLIIVPFYPVVNLRGPVSWSLGSFQGLSYTSRPYLPFSKSSSLAINPNLYYNINYNSNTVESLCVEDIGDGLASGIQTSYYGICGPYCLGANVTKNITVSNYKNKPLFFNIRVNVVKKPSQYNPINDLSIFPNANKSYLTTQLYLYNETTKPGSSLLDITNGWGQEKSANFIYYDNNSGYNYSSFLNNCQVVVGSKYVVNIRSILPTVSFSSNLRIVGKNWTEFGLLSLSELSSEIDDLVSNGVSLGENGVLLNDSYRIQKRYTYNYCIALLNFNAAFIGKFKFGVGFANANYLGSTVESTGYSDFINQYSELFKKVSASSTPLELATNMAAAKMKEYITKNYKGVLPDYALNRNIYTDPLLFSIKFKSALEGPYVDAFDQWGLGWNLGFNKTDTPLLARHISQTFIRIIDDFIYLKLNDEFNMNTIDISDKEQLNKNRDTFGKNKAYFGKLLLNTFGSYSQTFIQSSKGIVVPLGKLDKLSFSFFDAKNNQIFNTDCEFTVVMDIGESLDWLDPNSVLVRGSAPK